MCSPKAMMISGAVIVVLAAIFAGVFNSIFNAVVAKLLVIDPNNAIFDSFQSPPIPVYFQVYFFNVSNPHDIQYYGGKPNLTEIGPFTYEEFMEKRNFSGSEEPGTIEYVQNKYYKFVPEMSVADESFEITTMNAVMVLTAAVGYTNKTFSRWIWPEIERTMNLFETFTVGELMFDGWEMPEYNFNFYNVSFIADVPLLNGTLHDILCEIDEDELCFDFLAKNRVGLFSGQNDTDDGRYRVNTGEEDMSTYLFIRQWKGSETLHYWHDEYCDMINGTDGTQFPPKVDDDIVFLYTSDLCRSLYLNYEKEVDIFDKVKTKRYVASPELLADPNTYPDNYCFCNKVIEEDDKCPESSMLNMAPCSGGIPIVLSTPHYYMGEPGEPDKFIGIHPVKELHQTFIDIEPKTGVAMAAAKRIQINLPLRQYGNLPSFQSVPHLEFPILWGDENAAISEEDADDLFILYLPFTLVYVFCGLFILLGLILIGFGYSKYRKVEMEPKMILLNDK